MRFDDVKILVKAQEKKINELATREQIKILECADKQLQQQIEFELEQL